MPNIDFNVESQEQLVLTADHDLSAFDLMSPFVWQEPDGSLAIMVRAVIRNRAPSDNTGSIYFGVSTDGLSFRMDKTPVLPPGPGKLDVGGCEDPTVVIENGRYVVYYTGVDETHSSGQMLYAEGPDPRHLEKKGVALASSKTEGNTKEATIEQTADGRWRLFYEYAENNTSRVGLALGDGVAGPWSELAAPFAPRVDSWDNWHLSTGPLLTTDPDMPVMFYNGATQDARWADRLGGVRPGLHHRGRSLHRAPDHAAAALRADRRRHRLRRLRHRPGRLDLPLLFAGRQDAVPLRPQAELSAGRGAPSGVRGAWG